MERRRGRWGEEEFIRNLKHVKTKRTMGKLAQKSPGIPGVPSPAASPDIMRQFGFSLSGWQKLNLCSEHVMPAMASNFDVSTGEVQRILDEKQPIHKVTHLSANR